MGKLRGGKLRAGPAGRKISPGNRPAGKSAAAKSSRAKGNGAAVVRGAVRSASVKVATKPAEGLKSIGSVLNSLVRLFNVTFERRSRSLGLTRPQWQLLLHLHRRPGMTQTELAAVLELSVPTIANLVHRLIDRGWIEMRIDPGHRLNKYLFLLPAVRPLLTRVHKVARSVDEASTRRLSGKEAAQLLSLLSRLKESLVEVNVARGR